MRGESALDSDEVNVLYSGDIVEQAGPALKMLDGIWRMPVSATVQRRRDGNEGIDSDGNEGPSAASLAKTLGWVTIDASPNGGPVYFKPVADPDVSRRRRRKNGAS